MNVRTEGFCSALLRCGEIKLIARKSASMPFKLKLRTLCVPKDFVRRRFVLAIFAIRSEIKWHTRAFPRSTLFLRNEAMPNKILWYARL